VIFMLILLFIAHIVLSRSRFGLHTYAVGGNKEAALRAGIPVSRTLIAVYMTSAMCAAFAGVLYGTRFTNGAANAGEALLLDSIAAVVIGGASLFGGAGSVIGTLDRRADHRRPQQRPGDPQHQSLLAVYRRRRRHHHRRADRPGARETYPGIGRRT
jgi:branched-subunit amino acid ABC-type transport system permease component